MCDIDYVCNIVFLNEIRIQKTARSHQNPRVEECRRVLHELW